MKLTVRRLLLAAAVTGVLTIGLSALAGFRALAIPSQTPHTNNAQTIQWEDDGTKNGLPDDCVPGRAAGTSGAHNHRSAHSFRGFLDGGEPYTASKVWDDRFYMVDQQGLFQCGHGFIQETDANRRPRYIFSDDAGVWDNNAKDVVTEAFQRYNEVISDQPALKVGIEFTHVASGPAEIKLLWKNEGGANCGGEWDPGTKTQTFDSSLNWSFALDPAGIPNDKWHFYSVALHEIGHIVALGHQDDNGDLMKPSVGVPIGGFPGCVPNATPFYQGLDADTKDGVRDLYSIPVEATLTPTPIPPGQYRIVIDCDGYYTGATSLTLTLNNNEVTTIPLTLNCSPGGQARETLNAPSNWNDSKLKYWCDVTKPSAPPPPPLNTLDIPVPPRVELDKWYGLECPSTGVGHPPTPTPGATPTPGGPAPTPIPTVAPGEPRIQLDRNPVGGIAEAPDVDASPLEGTASGGSSSAPYAAIAGAAAAGVVVLGAGGWYLRRRGRAG